MIEPSSAPPRRGPSFHFALFAALALVLVSSPGGHAQQPQSATPVQPKKKPAMTPAQRAQAAGAEPLVFRDDRPGQRERWFYEQRAYPLGYIPFGIRQRAFEAREAMRARERRLGIGSFAPRARTTTVPGGAPPPFPQSIPANMLTWTPIGPQPTMYSTTGVQTTSGRISAVAVDPTDANVVYIGGAQGGVWKSTDGGSNWTALTDDQPSLAIGAISIAPSNPQVIYIGTGEQTNSLGSYYGAGILRSTDGGASWTHLPGILTCGHVDCMGAGVQPSSFLGPHSGGFSPGGGARISSIAIDPTNPNLLLAGVFIFRTVNGGASSGIYRSTDGGVNWTNVRPGAAGSEVVMDPGNPAIAYGALGTVPNDPDNGIYKSLDGGLTWTKQTLPAPVTASNAARIEIAIAPSTPTTLYASVADATTGSDDLLGMFKTVDGGTTWNSLGTGAPFSGTSSFCSPQCWYDHVIKVHPNDANVVYAGGGPAPHFFTRSTNGGTVWTPATAGPNGNLLHVDQHAMAFGFSGGAAVKLYLGNDGGLWSTDVTNAAGGTIDWTNHNANLNITQFYPGLSMSPATVDFSFGGAQDNGSQKFTGGLQWERIFGGDGGWTAIDPSTPSTVYVTCQFVCVNKSTAFGNSGSFSPAEIGLGQNDPVEFIAPFIIDAAMPSRLYFGTDRVYQTFNGAASWFGISQSFGSTITTIAVAPNNSAVVYAGTFSGRVFVSTDVANGSGTFTSMSAGLPTRNIRQIAVDPTDPMKAYVTFSGFFGTGPNFSDNLGHVFVTTNGGVSWTDISRPAFSQTPLPNTPVNDLVIDSNIPGALYVGTDVGAFFTSDGGITWQTLQSGLPNVAVLGLKLHPSRILRAATHGRGMWDLLLPPGNATYQIQSLSPPSATAGSGAFQLTVNGIGFTMQSQVNFNGIPKNTTFISANRIVGDIPASDIATGGTVQVNVVDPVAGTSNTLPFSINHPVPTLASITPASAVPGGLAFTLTLDGSGFIGAMGGMPLSEVRWDGSPRTANATLVSSNQITVDIPASDIASAGLHFVTIFNPAPGGGTSSAQTFTVGTPPPNDNFASGFLFVGLPGLDTQNTSAASQEPGEPAAPCGAPGNFHSIWYRFAPASNVVVNVDTINSNFDTVLSVWTGATLGSLANVACDDDGGSAVGGGGASSLIRDLALTAGTTYHFMIGGFCNPSDPSCAAGQLPGYRVAGTAWFHIVATPDFALSANPTSVTVTRGQTSAPITITATPVNAPFTSAINFSCTGLPSQSLCVFNPPSLTPSGAPATAFLTITTTAPGMVPGSPLAHRRTPPPVAVLLLSLLALLLLTGAIAALSTRHAPAWRMPAWRSAAGLRFARRACVVAVVVLAGLSVSCGGGGGGAPPGPPPNPGTPTGSFTVTVRGTSGALVHTTNVTLNVQ